MDDKIKQVIIVRTHFPHPDTGKDYKPRTGKIVAQGAHAAKIAAYGTPEKPVRIDNLPEEFKEWYRINKLTTVVVYVKTEEELIDIHKQALSLNLPCSMIEDSGLTEFRGKLTKTAVAIGPHYSSEIDTITKELPLL